MQCMRRNFRAGGERAKPNWRDSAKLLEFYSRLNARLDETHLFMPRHSKKTKISDSFTAFNAFTDGKTGGLGLVPA